MEEKKLWIGLWVMHLLTHPHPHTAFKTAAQVDLIRYCSHSQSPLWLGFLAPPLSPLLHPSPSPPWGCLEVAQQGFAWACPLPQVRESCIAPAQNPARCQAYVLINKCLLTLTMVSKGRRWVWGRPTVFHLVVLPDIESHSKRQKQGKEKKTPNFCIWPDSYLTSHPENMGNFIPFLSFFFLIPFIFISWRLVTLQYCSGFCHTLTWISDGFTCIPHPDCSFSNAST